MIPLFGNTRTVVARRHALIAPDGHVPSVLPGFKNAVPFFVIAPPLSATFAQILIRFSPEGSATFPADGTETALYVQSGLCEARIGDSTKTLDAGGFVFCPAGTELELESSDAVITCFRKTFVAGEAPPPPIFGHANQVEGVPFLGNPKALLKTLLPDDTRFDLAMNVFTYQPGATLPFVETHIMEHGLLMLSGQGIYRLENSYYPVCEGDAIWMAGYCPQWFVAMGDDPASYLYYKDVNRQPALS